MKSHSPSLLIATLLAACGEKEEPAIVRDAPGPAWFENEAQSAGLDFTLESGHQGRYFFPEIMCGGVALFDMEDDGDLDVYFVHAPLDGRGVEPVTFAAGDGLALTLRPDALTPPLGYALVDVAARAVPLAWMPPIPELGGETLVGVYALHPFGALSAEPIAVRAPSTLPAGTPVWFRTISELDGRCSEPVPGRADGRVVETTPSAGIDALTWLIISR